MSEFFTTSAAPALAEASRRPDRPAGRVQRLARRADTAGRVGQHLDDVRAAQRLRHEVFVDEMGAQPTPAAGAPRATTSTCSTSSAST